MVKVHVYVHKLVVYTDSYIKNFLSNFLIFFGWTKDIESNSLLTR